MAIIKTIQEVKNLLPRLLSGLSNNALMPNVDRATEKYLVPVVGDALVTEIETAYNAEPKTLNAAQLKLLPKMQLVVVAGAYLDDLAFNQAMVTDNGIRSAETANMPKVFGWQYKELKDGLQLVSLDALDVLLQYLQNHKADFAGWTNSEAFKQFDALLIKTAMEFDNIHKLVQPFRTFYGLKTEMGNVQEQYIIPSIGPELFDRLNSATDLSDAEKIIRKQLQKAIAFYTIKRACEHYAVRIDQNGFTVVAGGDQESTTAGRTQAAPGLVKQKMDACDRDGGNWLAKARNLLVALRNSEETPTAFDAAFAKSPLVKYVQPVDRTTGNERRKLFRM